MENSYINRLFDLTGKVAVITGSSRGLGRAYAEGYAKAGATVVLNGSNQDTLDRAVSELKSAGYSVYGCCFDVSDEEQVNAAVDRIEQEIGPIDILINNAGIQRRHMLAEMPLDDWKRVIDVNLTSAFLMGKAVANHMMKRGRGKIINITSLNAVMARPNIGNYCASKGGLTMLTKSMATEWGKYGITANGVGPGYIETDLTRVLVEDPQFDSWVKSEVPLARWGKPEDIVGTVIFLGSAASDYMNGQTIYVDGGWQACL